MVPSSLISVSVLLSVFLSCLSFIYIYVLLSHAVVYSFSSAGSDGAASSYHVKQLEEQNGRLKEALVRSVKYLKKTTSFLNFIFFFLF